MTSRSDARQQPRILRRVDDQLCLEFVNTVAWRKSTHPNERLPSPDALLDWCVKTGSLSPGSAVELRRRWEHRPDKALASYRQAVELREALYGLFRSKIAGEPVAKANLDVFNAALEGVPPRRGLTLDGKDLGWRFGSGRSAASEVLAPLVWSAADLITSARAQRLRQCEDPKGCGWLFLDESRAGTRRWCSMGDCGNRAKARRHHLRTRERKGPRENPAREVEHAA